MVIALFSLCLHSEGLGNCLPITTCVIHGVTGRGNNLWTTHENGRRHKHQGQVGIWQDQQLCKTLPFYFTSGKILLTVFPLIHYSSKDLLLYSKYARTRTLILFGAETTPRSCSESTCFACGRHRFHPQDCIVLSDVDCGLKSKGSFRFETL